MLGEQSSTTLGKEAVSLLELKKKFNNYLVNFNKKLKKEKIAPIQASLNFLNSINEIDKIEKGIRKIGESF